MAALEKLLVTPGGVLSFNDNFGIAFFAAPLTPSEIWQVMGENVGIETTAPNENVQTDRVRSSKMKKRDEGNFQTYRVRSSKIGKGEETFPHKVASERASPETSGIHFYFPFVSDRQ